MIPKRVRNEYRCLSYFEVCSVKFRHRLSVFQSTF